VEPVAFRVSFHDRFAYWVCTAFLAFQSGFAGVVVVSGGWWGAIWAVPSPLRSYRVHTDVADGLRLSSGGGVAEGRSDGPAQMAHERFRSERWGDGHAKGTGRGPGEKQQRTAKQQRQQQGARPLVALAHVPVQLGGVREL